jgi:single-stranded-DNA-specific exonuclease
MAAGITVEREKLSALRAFLEERLAQQVRAAEADRDVQVDAAITESGATAAFVEDLERGKGHVRLSLASGAGGNLKAMAFRAAETPLGRALLAARGQPLHVAGTLSLDHYGGTARPQLRVIDAAEPDGRF